MVRIEHKVDTRRFGTEELFTVKIFRHQAQETLNKYCNSVIAEYCIAHSLHHPNLVRTLELLEDERGHLC
jgi:protein-serine/threonine kinase